MRYVFIFLWSVNIFANTPTISNFRVKETYKNRIYFDVLGDINALTTQGFTVSGKTITSINTTGNYFTISTPFTFWDNNTIRLEGGDGTIDDFTLSYIDNNILEPKSSGNVYYVSPSGNDSNDGLSEINAFSTIQKAQTVATAGSTVWIKAGVYAIAGITGIKNNGTATNPIKYIGYKTTIGDINSMYYSISGGSLAPALNSTEMPLLDGGGRNAWGFALHTLGGNYSGREYTIIKNIQFKNLVKGIVATNATGIIVENCVFKDNKGDGIQMTQYKKVNGDYYYTTNHRVIGCISANSGMHNFEIVGNNNLVANSYAYCDTSVSDASDYYISIAGSYNIITNCHSERQDPDITHGGHGIQIRGVSSNDSNFGVQNSYNLIEKSYAKGTRECFSVRNLNADYNVFKDCEAAGHYPSGGGFDSVGITLYTSNNNNIFERIYSHDVSVGIVYKQHIENQYLNGDGIYNESSINNIVRNSTFYNMGTMIQAGTALTSGTAIFENNRIENCTFDKAFRLADIQNSLTDYSFANNVIINSSFTGVTTYLNNLYGSISIEEMFAIDHSNFYNNAFTKPTWSTNSVEFDPKFESISNGKFNLKEESELIDKGINLNKVKSDFIGTDRPQGTSTDIGAYEFIEPNNSTGLINANAGDDVSICSGESTTLTASGGSNYSWSTGATTKSITVSPNTTQTYTVTVSDGTSSDSDDVIVTVNTVTANAGTDKTIDEGNSVTLSASGGDSYLWDTGATTQDITVSPTSTKTYTITVTKNGCTDTDTVQVTVNAVTGTVTANAGADQAICQGASATLTASGGSSYSWSTGATSKSITVSPNTTQTYTVTVSDGSSSDSDDVIVTVNTVTANAGTNKTINEGDSITLIASGGDSYLWDTGATTQEIIVSPTSTKTYTVTVTKNGCTDTDTVQVTVNPVTGTVNANAGADVTICGGDEGTMLTASGGSTYLWNTGATTQSISVNPATTQTYTVTVSDGSSSDSDDVTVTVNSVTANAGSNVTINEGNSTILNASGGDSYLWDTGATTQNITVSPNSTRTYTVTVTKNGCTDTDTVQVTVNPVTVFVTANAGADQSICLGDSATLTASGGSSYSWSTGATTPSITVSPSSTKTYTVTVSDGSSSDSDDVIVTVNTVIASAGSDITINQGETAKLNASGGGSYLWSTGATTQSITVSPINTSTYSVIVTKNGCSSVDELIITVESIITNPAPAEAFAGDDISICLGESIVLTASGGESYLWSTGDTENTINVNPTRTTTYTLSATRGGTTDTDTVIVTVENCSSSFDTIKDENSSFVVYPNPTDGNITIDLKMKSTKEDFNIFIVDLKGSVVYRDNLYATQNELIKQLNLSRLAKGVYYVRLVNSKKSLVKKIIYI